VNAKFGTISLGCFAVFWAIAIYSAQISSHALLPPFFWAWAVCLPFGIITGKIGTRRKESPKWYSIVGLLLNAGMFILFARVFID
jgi:predicted membrane protein